MPAPLRATLQRPPLRGQDTQCKAPGKDAFAHRARAPVTHHGHPEIRLVCPETPCHSHAWRSGTFPAQVTMKKQPDIYDVGLAVVYSIADLLRSSSTEEIFS